MRDIQEIDVLLWEDNGGVHGQPSAETERADSLKSRQATEIGPCVPFSAAICVSQHPVIALCCSIDFVLNPGLVTDTLSYYLQPSVPSPPPSSEYLPKGPMASARRQLWKQGFPGAHQLITSVCKGCLRRGWPLHLFQNRRQTGNDHWLAGVAPESEKTSSQMSPRSTDGDK